MTQMCTDAGRSSNSEGPTLLSGWISRSALALELGVCEETLRRWADARRGPPYIRAGRKILYRRSAVLDWLEEQETIGQRRGRRGARR